MPAFDAQGRIRSAGASALVGHATTARCYEVRTRYGRSVRVTGHHSLFVEGPDGRPEPRPVAALSTGDRVAIAGVVRVPERDRRVVAVTEVWDAADLDPWDLLVHAPGMGATVWRHRRELLPAIMARRRAGSVDRRSCWAQVVRYRDGHCLPLGALRRLGIALPQGPDVRLRSRGSKVQLPASITVTDELLWLLGLYVAEGCRHDGSSDALVALSCGPDLLEQAAKILERDLGVPMAATPAGGRRWGPIVIRSRLLLVVLDHLGFPAGPKRIPGWVLGLPLPRLKWFLEGYRAAGGGQSAKKLAAAGRHEFSTVSADLKDDLVVALGRFGLVPTVGSYESTSRPRTGGRRHGSWRLTVSGVDPWSPLDWDQGVTQRLNARRSHDLVWATVTSVREVQPSDAVYDFCVPGFENFWAGVGVMVHNTYGPRMRVDDGRAVPTFFSAALRNRPLPLHGDGSQTRSLCYVDDMIDGLLRLLLADYVGPVNLGNPQEVTVRGLAEAVQAAVGRHPGVEFQPRPTDDPSVRCPDTTLAEQLLGWRAQVGLREGLARTAGWFRDRLTGTS
ncbi:MAG: GDP-mannose 4,6-dehydratase [Actinomycetota bacterium]|nr:GDP-mannose 4,6-dehydratase [Actinomycetota bacterium]